MNTNQRGERQSTHILIRCAPTDKVKVKLAAMSQGTSVSGLVKRMLMDAGIIDPVNATIE